MVECYNTHMQDGRGDPGVERSGGHAALGAVVRGERGFSFRGTFASLAYRDFTYLWLGQVTHAFALWLEQVARPLLVLALTGSATQLGLVILTRTIPAVVLGMLAGAVADNFNRRAVLLGTKVVVLGLSAVFALLVVTGWVEIWHIYLFSFLRGAAMAFDQPARRAMIPTIVPAHLVVNAMALSTGSMQIMRVAGAAAAGFLMGYMGLSAPFVGIVVVYIGAVFFTWMLRPADHERTGYQGARSLGNDLLEGLRFAWGTPDVRGILIIALGYFTFGMSFMQVFAPVFAEHLQIGKEGFGYMISFLGVGGLIGALVLAGFNPSKGRGTLLLVLLIGFGISLTVFSAVTYLHSVLLAFAVVFVVGMVQSSFFPLVNSLLVGAAPVNMRGRVLGVLSLDRATMALGGATAGALIDRIGVQDAQMLFGLVCIATGVAMYVFYPQLRHVN